MKVLLLAIAALLVYDVFMVGKHLGGAKTIARLAPIHLPLVVLALTAFAFLVRQDAQLRMAAFIGLIPAVFGLVLVIAAMISLREQIIVPGKLVREGIYARLRNPLYSGMLLIAIGTLFVAPTWRVGLLVGLLFVSFRAVIRAEEIELAKRLGQPYLEYLREVPALIPRLWRRR